MITLVWCFCLFLHWGPRTKSQVFTGEGKKWPTSLFVPLVRLWVAVPRASRKRLHEDLRDLTRLTFNFLGDAEIPAPPTWLVTIRLSQHYILRVGTLDARYWF